MGTVCTRYGRLPQFNGNATRFSNRKLLINELFYLVRIFGLLSLHKVSPCPQLNEQPHRSDFRS